MKKFNTIFASAIISMLIVHCTLIIDNCEAQWVQTQGPKGAYVNCFAASGSYVFAGTNYGGIYRSGNNGVSWIQVNNGINTIYNKDIISLCVKENYIFAGAYYGGIYRSTDNGENWTLLSGLWDQTVNTFAVIGGNIFAGAYGIYKSTDNGDSWSPAGLSNPSVNAFAVNGNNIFAGTYGAGVFLSTNDGGNWIPVNNNIECPYISSLAYNGNNIFAGTNCGDIYRSTNNGVNWVRVFLTNISVKSVVVNNNNIFAGTFQNGVYISSNNGGDWIQLNNGLTCTYINSLLVISNNLFAGTRSGIFISPNSGVNWTSANNNLLNHVTYSFAKKGNNVFAGTLQSGVYMTSDNGGSWISAGLLNQSVYSLAATDSIILAGTYKAGIYLSTNNGSNWITYMFSMRTRTIYSILLMGNDIFLASDSGVIKNGSIVGLTGQTIRALAVKGNNIFAGNYSNNGVYMSTNNGVNWTEAGLSTHSIFSLAVSGDNLFAGTNYYGVFMTTDNGVNWTEAGLSGHIVRSIIVSENYLIASITDFSNEGGVFLSSNNGANWTNKNQGFDAATSVIPLFIVNDYIFAGAVGHSVWKRTLSDITSVKQISSDLPSSFSLEQNYPNPFNPKTIISYQCPMFSNVSLVVYDALGKEVAILVNEKQSATGGPGTYQVEFDGSGLPSGVYFYRLTAGEFTDTKRMMLVK